MIKSIQYFNDSCAAEFEKIEDDFIREPTDISTYVLKITDILHRLGVRMIEETLEYLSLLLKESDVRKQKWVVDRNCAKQLTTSLGTVTYRKTLYKSKETGERCFLLDRIMEIRPHERITADAQAKMLEEAVQTSYARGGEQVSILDEVTKQTVKNKIHNLQFPPEDEALVEKRAPKVLFIDADEDHVALQFQQQKGDLTRTRTGRKNNAMIAKLVYVYEGIQSESPGSIRNKLINPHYFCSDSASEDNQAFWERVYSYIDTRYDLGKVERIYLNGDGGAWITAGKKAFAGVIATIDEFHLQSYLTKMTGHMKDSRWDAIQELRRTIRNGSKNDFRELVERLRRCLEEGNEQGAQYIEQGARYILENWMPCKVRLGSRKLLPGCSAEGHVSHVLSARMSTRAMGWSRRGAGRMSRLRVYYYNGGDMLKLVKFQRENLEDAVGLEKAYYSPTEVMRSEQSRHGQLGKYLASMQGSLPKAIKKKLWFSAHLKYL